MNSQDLFTQSPSKEDKTPGRLKKREEKKKLVDDIRNLKKLRENINRSLGYYKTARPFPEKIFIECEEKSVRDSQKVLDGIVILKEELYRYSGIYCAEYEQDKEYRFAFNSCKNVSKSETYFVQILTEEEKGKMGFWKMPVLLDVNEILSKCPIEDMRHVKNFVRRCKYYLDCQNNRKTQFEDLKTCIDELHTCAVQANLEIYTNIQLQIFMLREIETDKFYDIVLYIVYELTECRPTKLITDSLHEETLPEDVIRKLKQFFKNFKLLELKPAFEGIIDEEIGELFQWQKSYRNKDIVTENEEVDSDSFSQKEGNDISEMKSLTEEKGNEGGGQQIKEDNKVENEKLKKNLVGLKEESGKRKEKSLQNNPNGPELEKEKHDKQEKSNVTKRILKKAGTKKKLEGTQAADKKVDRGENSMTQVTKKMNKIRFEEEISARGQEDQLGETDEAGDVRKRQAKKRIPRKVKAKVFKIPRKSRRQTKLYFSRQNINTEKIRKFEGKEDTENVHEENNQTQNLNNNQDNPQESLSENKNENKENEVIKVGETSHKAPGETEIFQELNENPRISILESEVINKNKKNFQEITIKKTKKGRKIAEAKKDKNQNEILLQEGAEKKKKSQGVGIKSIKKTFDIRNSVLDRNEPASLSIRENFLNPSCRVENIGESSTAIKGKQSILGIETLSKEIIEVNKPIHMSPEKRPRSNSSNSDLDEIFEEPDQNLLKSLEQIQKKTLKSSAGLDYRKGKKPAKRVKNINKKARK